MKTKDVLRELGTDYRVCVIDREQVVYRDFGSFDVEISGLDTRLAGCTIYVWKNHQIAEIHGVKSLDALKAKLAEIERLHG